MAASALLLFLIQPMVGRMALPLLGGSPAVWTTCMLFFQTALLAGYAFAHAGERLLGVRRQALLHGVLVWIPLLALPLGLSSDATPPDAGEPVAWLLRSLTTTVGPPFVLLAASAPLLQRWFSATRHGFAADPYFLYAASNAGSLTALLAYPLVLEPLLTVGRQQAVWSAGYVLVAMLLLACALTVRFQAPEVGTGETPSDSPPGGARLPLARQLHWLVLAFAPSSLMLSVTTFLSTDVAAVPLLWIVPLAIYLLTFIAAFSRHADAVAGAARRLLPLVLLPLVLLLILRAGLPLWLTLPMNLLAFAALACLCHTRLAAGRPNVEHLTQYYLWLAGGGALGGFFNTLVAPVVFTGLGEYPLGLVLCCLLLASGPQIRAFLTEPGTLIKPVLAGAICLVLLLIGQRFDLSATELMPLLGFPALIAFAVSRDPARFAAAVALLLAAGAIGYTDPAWRHVLHAERTFFGVHRVTLDPAQRYVTLFHGTTVHGRQAAGVSNPEPLTYYHRGSGIGDVLAARDDRQQAVRSVGVVGLGVGSLAAYARPGERWTFYEIDPAVERIARDGRFFRYLEACGETCEVAIGDGRLLLERETAEHEVIVLDAFSSDAIPIHLLTTEALELYLSRLAPGGIIALHISNLYVELEPVLARAARDLGLAGVSRFDAVPERDPRGRAASHWVALARDDRDLAGLAGDPRWTRLAADDRPAWTDDFSNIWTALRWR